MTCGMVAQYTYSAANWHIGILTHCYIIKNVKILELNKNKFNTPLFFGRTFVLLKTHLP